MICGGSSFNFTRRKVYELCRKPDVIIMASPEADFESLRICADDYNNLLFKIRDIGRLMSPKKYDLPFALKFITYLLFKSKDPKGLHEAVADARLTMLSYIYDF